jgi:hypothetical protein
MSVSCWDVEKWIGSHNSRRTQAIASAKVGRVLPDHAVLRTQISPFSSSRCAVSVMIEERLTSAGVARAMA